MLRRTAVRSAIVAIAGLLASAVFAGAALADSGTVGNFSYGELDATTPGTSGCGSNDAGEPAIRVSPANNVFLSSERGLLGGTDLWRGLGAAGGSGASGCGLEYRGQPNTVQGTGASGGDTDMAIGAAKSGSTYPVYVASLWLGSVSVSHSNDDGSTFTNVPVVAGLPIDDREWIAAYRDKTSLLTYHDIATNNIDVLRSDDGGNTYVQTSRAIDDTDYKASSNELGNIAIDQQNTTGASDFWAYQSFVAPSSSSSSNYDEAFLSVSSDGGQSWAAKPIPCSTEKGKDLDHAFPNVSVGPSGDIWETWSDDTNVYAAVSSDHGQTWSCSGKISTGTQQAIYPWVTATSAGEDLVFYGSPDPASAGNNQTWYVYFVQNPSTSSNGWGASQQLMTVHKGGVCEEGVTCNGGRQLLDDFGVDTDANGWAHIAYTHDSPNLGDSGSYTGYAVQTAGAPVGSSMTSTPAPPGG